MYYTLSWGAYFFGIGYRSACRDRLQATDEYVTAMEGGGGGDLAAGTCTVTINAPNLACFKRVCTPSNCHFSTFCTIRKLEKAFIFNAYRTNESPPPPGIRNHPRPLRRLSPDSRFLGCRGPSAPAARSAVWPGPHCLSGRGTSTPGPPRRRIGRRSGR